MGRITLVAQRTFEYDGAKVQPGDEFEALIGDERWLTGGERAYARKPTAKRAKNATADFDVHSAKKAELEAEAERRGVEVEGTGADGNVLVDDLQKALK